MAFELPLFPLNTVLFPNMPLPLHIFEPRYRQLIQECLHERKPFGVVLIHEGVEVGGEAEPHPIGCTAEIAQIETQKNGTFNVLAIGQDRFRILSLNHDQPYLVGIVEAFPLVLREPEATEGGKQLRPWLEKYLHLLSQAGDMEFEAEKIPTEPAELAYLAATVLQVPNHLKQDLLSASDAAHMLTEIRALYQRELPVLRTLLAERQNTLSTAGPFSLN